MTNHLKGLLMTFIGVIILSPDSVLIRLADVIVGRYFFGEDY